VTLKNQLFFDNKGQEMLVAEAQLSFDNKGQEMLVAEAPESLNE
jgi:hypothetical protein